MAMPLSGAENTAGQSGNVPAFLSKLWRLVEDSKYDELISWSSTGQSFIIHNQNRFAKDVLPNFFKHNNMASFIRQLNMYGFRKMVNIDSGGLKGTKDDIEFYHNFFVRDQESMLEFIKRKATSHTRTGPGNGNTAGTNASGGGDELRNELVRELLTDVNQIQGKQEQLDSQLIMMKRENEALWREVAFLRRKHREQQQIVEKLIRFLVTLVHQARGGPKDNNISMKRKHTLMIDEGGKVRKTFQGPVRSKAMPTDSGITEIDCEDEPIVKDVTNDHNSPVAVRTGNGLGIISTQAMESSKDSKQLRVSQGKVMPSTQMEMLITSPASIDTALCDAADEVQLCDNLFDSDIVLSPSLADAQLPADTDSTAPSTALVLNEPSSTAVATARTANAAVKSTASTASGDTAGRTIDANLEDVLNVPFEEEEVISSSPPPSLSVLNTPVVEWSDSEPGPSRTSANASGNNGKGMEVAIQNPLKVSNAADVDGKLTAVSQKESLSEHCDGVETELDWLQDQIVAGGLNIDSSTLLGLFSTDDMLPNLTSDVTNVGGSSGGNNSQVVTYQTPSFLDLISPDEPVDESEVKLK
ncbi:heat shock factor protein-like isoform X2 [Varroa jacobsoni]|uniref:heat shock factor protein-like isoform X2 n=1 Tax=Varroa jacobsoni TaxID=62625 RepID=UPI000BF8BD77|nr:heat shock factor protein-like isoform X2 [Varroa jacobsoni]